jgi:hypothetical protein
MHVVDLVRDKRLQSGHLPIFYLFIIIMYIISGLVIKKSKPLQIQGFCNIYMEISRGAGFVQPPVQCQNPFG